MAKRHKLHLTDEETQILRHLGDTAEPAYLRERAGRCEPLAPLCLGSEDYRYRQCVRRCDASASAINAAEPMFIVRILNITQNSPVFNRL